MINRSLASLGRSLSVRLVLPNALNKPHIARMAVILASGKYLRPGTQSSGRAQYTTKKPLSQKKAPLVGSASLKEVRLLGVSAAVIVLLSPIATNSSFLLSCVLLFFALMLFFPLSELILPLCREISSRLPIAGPRRNALQLPASRSALPFRQQLVHSDGAVPGREAA